MTRGFPDHHPYAKRELDALCAEATGKGLIGATTEKDFVRLPGEYQRQAIALPVALRFEDEPSIVRLLAAALAQRRAD